MAEPQVTSPRRALLAFVIEYCRSRASWTAAALLLIVLAGNVYSVRLSLLMNTWNGRFFDALAAVDKETIMNELLYFAGLVTLIIFVLVMTDYLKSRLILKVRRDLTTRLFDRWLSSKSAHYRLRESGLEPDNPDQRLLEDSCAFVSLSINLFLSFIESILTIGTFTVVLWSLSMPLTLGNITIHGTMFWACIIYTVLGMLITHTIGYPLKALNFEAQHQEADLRYALIEKRRHADAIAGAHGEKNEHARLHSQLYGLIDLLIRRVKKERDLSLFTVGLGQITHMTPIILGLPALFAGSIALGGLMQLRGAFVDVARSLSWFIIAYDDLAKLAAVSARLKGLLSGLSATEKEASLAVSPTLSVAIRLSLPDGVRKTELTLSLAQGELGLITGLSGIGKSTTLKAIAGFYDRYEGTLERPESFLWLPQSPYLMKGTLRANLCYPNSFDAYSDEELKHWLSLMELEHLFTRLDETGDWRALLSGGEAQRIMLIRALSTQPALLLLDETTSAMDEDAALRILQRLRVALPHSAILMVTHQELSSLADCVITLNTTS